MNARLVIPVIFASVLSACSPKSDVATATFQDAGDFKVATQFSPDPPKQGPETITFTVKDANSSPLKDAIVSIKSDMPTMSMAGPKLNATDNGDGTYSVQTTLNYATEWDFAINVMAGGKSGTANIKEIVK